MHWRVFGGAQEPERLGLPSLVIMDPEIRFNIFPSVPRQGRLTRLAKASTEAWFGSVDKLV